MKTYFINKPEYPCPDISGTWEYIKYPAQATIKMDGEFDYLVGASKYLINPYGRVREDLPITHELAGFKGILAGELYYDTGKSFFEEMLSHKFSAELKFYAFDILQYGDTWVTDEPLHYRRSLLELIKPSEHIRIAEQYLCKDRPAVMQLFEKVTAQGYEGLVIKNLDSRFVDGTMQGQMKLKKFATADVFCIGYKKGKYAIAIGTEAKKPMGAVSNAGKGWRKAYELVKAQQVIAENKEYCFVEPIQVIEVKYTEILKSGMFRNPVFIRPREKGKEVKI